MWSIENLEALSLKVTLGKGNAPRILGLGFTAPAISPSQVWLRFTRDIITLF